MDHEVFVGKNYAISKATLKKVYGKAVAGYNNCELLFFKYSQENFRYGLVKFCEEWLVF